MSDAREEDIQFLEGKVKSNPESLLFARLADHYLKSNRVADAIHICEEGIKKYPFYATGHFVLGKGYLANKQFEQAEKEFKRVLLFDPKYLAAHKNYGDLMKEIGWENTCESSYRKILQIDPLDEIARSVVGEHILHADVNVEEPRGIENGQQGPPVIEAGPIGPTDETVRSVPKSVEKPPEEADQAFDDADFDWDEPQTGTSGDETTPDETKSEEVTSKPKVTQVEDSSPDEPQSFDFNASEWEEAVSEKKGDDPSESFDFNSLGPMPVDSDEEEDMLFKDDETTTKSPHSLLDEDDLELKKEDSHKEEEFSYLLDDIFKDEVSSADSDLSIDEPVDKPEDDILDDDGEDPWEGLQMDLEADDVQVRAKAVEPEEDIPIHPGSDVTEDDHDSDTEDEVSFESIMNKGLSSPVPVQKTDPKTHVSAPKVEHQPVKAGKSSADKIVTPTLGEIYAAQGQYSKAIDVFETLLKKYPDNDLYVGKIEQLKKKLADEAQS